MPGVQTASRTTAGKLLGRAGGLPRVPPPGCCRMSHNQHRCSAPSRHPPPLHLPCQGLTQHRCAGTQRGTWRQYAVGVGAVGNQHGTC